MADSATGGNATDGGKKKEEGGKDDAAKKKVVNRGKLPKRHTWRKSLNFSKVVRKWERENLGGWVIAVVLFLEAAYAIDNNGETINVSVQQILHSCSRGIGEDALVWINTNGVTMAEEYPYVGDKGTKFELERLDPLKCNDEEKIQLREHPLFAKIRVTKKFVYGENKVLCAVKSAGEEVQTKEVLLIGWDVVDGIPVWEALDIFGPGPNPKGFFYFKRNSANRSFLNSTSWLVPLILGD